MQKSKKRELSGNETRQLLKLRSQLAKLCPETDGLQRKHRIKRTLKEKNRQRQVEEIMDVIADECLSFSESYKDAKLISLIYFFDGFSSTELFQILRNNRFRNR